MLVNNKSNLTLSLVLGLGISLMTWVIMLKQWFATGSCINYTCINSSLHLLQNLLGYWSADIICSEEWTVFRDQSWRKTVSFEEQIMSQDKIIQAYFQSNRGAFIILRIFFATYSISQFGFQNPQVFQFISRLWTDFTSVERMWFRKKYNISVKGKQTFSFCERQDRSSR